MRLSLMIFDCGGSSMADGMRETEKDRNEVAFRDILVHRVSAQPPSHQAQPAPPGSASAGKFLFQNR